MYPYMLIILVYFRTVIRLEVQTLALPKLGAGGKKKQGQLND